MKTRLVLIFILILTLIRLVTQAQFVRISDRQFEDANGDLLFPIVMNYYYEIANDTGTSVYYVAPNRHYGTDRAFECTGVFSCLEDIRSDMDNIKNMGYNTIHLVGLSPETEENAGFKITTYTNETQWSIDKQKHFLSSPYFQDPFIPLLFEMIDSVIIEAARRNLYVILDGQKGDQLNSLTEEIEYSGYLGALARHIHASNDSIKRAVIGYILVGEPIYGDETVHRSKQEVCELTKVLYDSLKLNDPHHLVGLGGISFQELFEWDPYICKMDFYFPHYYIDHVPQEYLGPTTGFDLDKQLNRTKGMFYWMNNFLQRPYLIGEIGFSADQIYSEDSLETYDYFDDKEQMDGDYLQQSRYIDSVLTWVCDCGGAGLSFWQYQDVWWGTNFESYLSHARHGLTNNGGMANLLKPAAHRVINYSGNSVFLNRKPCNPSVGYDDPFGCKSLNPARVNSISGFVVDKETQLPIEGAYVKYLNTIGDYIQTPLPEIVMKWYYTFSDSIGNFEIVPFNNYMSNGNKVVNVQVTAPGYGIYNTGEWPFMFRDQTNYMGGKIELRKSSMEFSTTLSGVSITGNQTYSSAAWSSINVQDFQVLSVSGSSPNVTLTAREFILFNPEIHVSPGSEVHVYLSEPFIECSDISTLQRLIKPANENVATQSLKKWDELEIDFNVNPVIRIYPNPVDEWVTLELPDSLFEENINMRFNLFDINGRVIKDNKLERSRVLINVSDVLPGLYILIVKTDCYDYSYKIIKF